MARIHCTLVETSVMAAGYEIGSEDHNSPLPAAERFEQHSDREPRLEPEFCDLLPWADPYIASLVHALHAASGAELPDAWPRSTGLRTTGLGSEAPPPLTAPENRPLPPRRRNERWPERFRGDR